MRKRGFKERIAVIVIWALIAPIMPFYFTARFGEWLQHAAERAVEGRWVDWLAHWADRVEQWQREPSIQGVRVITPKPEEP